MRSALLSVAAVLAAGSGSAAHIEEFEVEVADWFLTGASVQPGGVSIVEFEGEGGVLGANGTLGPLAADSDGAIIQFVLEGHIHGEIEEGQVFLVEYSFDPMLDTGIGTGGSGGGSLAILGGQCSVEALLDDGSLFGIGGVSPNAPLTGSFRTSALELLGGPIVANHEADEAGFILALNLGWTDAAPGDRLSLGARVTITPIPAPGIAGAWGVGGLAALLTGAVRRRRR